MFCELAVVIMMSGQPVLKSTPWHGGARTEADGGLTKAHCDEFVGKYNLTHEKHLVCVCK